MIDRILSRIYYLVGCLIIGLVFALRYDSFTHEIAAVIACVYCGWSFLWMTVDSLAEKQRKSVKGRKGVSR